jgi:hypothetical protein
MDVLDRVNSMLDSQTVTTVVSLLLALYAALVAPALPNSVILLFDTIPGKVLLLFLIGFTASRNIQVALMIAVAFVITLHIINKRVTEQYINFLTRENFISTSNKDTEEADEDVSEETGALSPGLAKLIGRATGNVRTSGFTDAIKAGIERFVDDKQDTSAEGLGCKALKEDACEHGANKCFWNTDKCSPLKENFIDLPGLVQEAQGVSPEDAALNEEGGLNLDEEGELDPDEESTIEGMKVDVDEEVDIEQYDNFSENFYSSMEQWKRDGVKPAYNLSGNPNKLHAPVNY